MGDLSLREIAGVCTGSGKPLTDEAVRQRLAACPQWVESLLGKLLPARALPERAEGAWQLVIWDGAQRSRPPVPVTWVRQQTRHSDEIGAQISVRYSFPVRPT